MGRNQNNSPWTDERIELLKRLHAEGLSASQIAAEMFGDKRKRNSIIGKCHRLGLRRTKKVSPRPRQLAEKPNRNPTGWRGYQVKRPPEASLARPAPLLDEPAIITGVTLGELQPYHCRWINGDPRKGDFRYCGCRKWAGSSYCMTHSKRSAA